MGFITAQCYVTCDGASLSALSLSLLASSVHPSPRLLLSFPPPCPLSSAGNYLLTLLGSKGVSLETYAVKALVSLLVRLTKFAWLDGEGVKDYEIRRIVPDVQKFLQATVQHCIIGLRILNELVVEMNAKAKNRTLTQHRKVAVSFRDTALFPVFEISLTMLHQVATRSISTSRLPPAEADRAEDMLLELTLSLISSCLGFDFIGTSPDESSEELGTVQVPSSWKDRLQNGATLRLLFNVYKGCTTGKIPTIPDAPPPAIGAGGMDATGLRATMSLSLSGHDALRSASSSVTGLQAAMTRDFRVSEARAAQTLDTLSYVVSIRRSLFTVEAERRRFLNHVLRGLVEVMRDGSGLASTACFHGAARLLNRVKVNHSLADLMATEGYAEWLEAAAAFTLQACANPVKHANSMQYALGLWSRMTANVPYLQLEGISGGPSSGSTSGAGGGMGSPPSPPQEHLLDRYVPMIVNAFIRGWMDALVGPYAADALEELENTERLEDTLAVLPQLVRFQYESAAASIAAILDPLLEKYGQGVAHAQNALATGGAVPPQVTAALRVLECQLAWVITLIGAVILGASLGSNSGSAGSGLSIYDVALAVAGFPTNGGGGGRADASPPFSAADPAASAAAALGDEVHDADLSRRVLMLVHNLDQHISGAAKATGLPSALAARSPAVRALRIDARLENALLYFINNFRTTFITEAAGMPVPPAPASGLEGSGSVLLLAPKAKTGGAGAGAGTGAGAGAGGLPGTGGAATAGAAGSASPSTGPQSLIERLQSSSGRQKTFLYFFLRMDLGDHTTVVAAMLQKVANNLRYWGDSDAIIKRTLDVFSSLMASYSSGRLVLSLDAVSELLAHHTEDYFPFLANPANAAYRTVFYNVLAKLVFFDDTSDRFEPFIAPLITTLDRLTPVVQAGARGEDVARALIGAARDLRGIVTAAQHRSTYATVFDTLVPRYTSMLAKAIEVWADTPAVVYPLLKLFGELVFSRQQRIAFGSSSPNGVILFREASKAIVAYGRRAAAQPVPPGDATAYAARYKGVAITISILVRALDGGYFNTGVFALYGDPCLDAAMDVVFQLVLSHGSAREVMAYPKLALWFMTLLHLLCRSHVEHLVNLAPGAFQQLITLLADGLDSLDQEVALQAAHALDFLASFFVRNLKKDTPVMAKLRAHVAASPSIFEVLMKMLFNILVWGEAVNLRGMGRPLLALILAAEAVRKGAFEEFKAEIIRGQPEDARARLDEEFGKLTKDVTVSLDFLNRDRFDARLTLFKLAVKDFAKY